MRDPRRIDRIIEKLREAWHAVPDQRLGQLVINVARNEGAVIVCPTLFYLEDEVFETRLAKETRP